MAKAKIKSTKIHDTFGDKMLDLITTILLIALMIIIAYPIIYCISCSFSSSRALQSGQVVLWPVDPSLEGYKFILQYKQVWVGFRNSLFYTVCDVLLQMTMTILVAFPLSRPHFQGKTGYTLIFYLSTRIGAGMIPGFILKCNLGLFNNIWAVLISGSISVSHILILRTCFKTAIPGELFDSAMLDGANYFQACIKIALPLAKATLSVLILYCIVGQWNEYFTSLLYLRDNRLYPLQLVLRPIMTAATAASQMQNATISATMQQNQDSGLENVRYGLIIISTVPVLLVYAAVQKSFKGGVMMGSVKG